MPISNPGTSIRPLRPTRRCSARLSVHSAGSRSSLGWWLVIGDKQKARDTLAALLNLWKNPDPNLVILNQAKTAYAGL